MIIKKKKKNIKLCNILFFFSLYFLSKLKYYIYVNNDYKKYCILYIYIYIYILFLNIKHTFNNKCDD